MYIPKAFAETDQAKLFEFMRANSFGILFSQGNGQPYATHLPFLLETDEAQSRVVLWGHFAKANPHWKMIEGEVLAVFSGPHAYISPAWYEAENTVPTWNYTAVHAYGSLTLTHEQEDLLKIVAETVEFYERSRPNPWQFDAANEFYHKLAGGIVGFKIDISRLEGKWKLNQNHPLERQEKVVKALQQSTRQTDRAIAALMAENLAKAGGTE
jgi:transcriptional regulator